MPSPCPTPSIRWRRPSTCSPAAALSDGQDNVDFSLHHQTSPDAQLVTVGLVGSNASMDCNIETSEDPQTDDSSHFGLDITLQDTTKPSGS